MASALTKLKGFIQTYTGFNGDQMADSDLEELKSFVREAVSLLRREMEEEITNLKDENERSHYVYDIQAQLTYLADGLTGFDKEDNESIQISGIFEWILYSIFKLLDHIRIYFTIYFNFSADLPAQFIIRYKVYHNLFQRDLIDNLNKNKLDPDLTSLLENYVLAFDKPDRIRIKTWRQWDYLLKMMQTLSHFIAEPPNDDLSLELLKVFICRDFNSIHIYAYFLKYIERTTLSEGSFQEQQQELLYLLKVFQQVRVDSQDRYDTNVQPLKTSVVESILAELNYLEQKEKLFLQDFKSTTADAPSKFYFSVVVTLAELMFYFRVMLEVGFIQTKFNSYLYEFISNHIRTPRAENISKKSMRNHFSNKPFPDRLVLNVRTWLGKMITHIDLYYKV